MPVSYTFVNNITGMRETISHIDDLVCQFFNKEPEKDDCCIEYETLVLAGITCSFHTGVTDEKNVEEYLGKSKTLPTSDFGNAMRKFLYQDYHMDTWRGGF